MGGVVELRLNGQINKIDKDWSGELYRPARFTKTQSKGEEVEVITVPYFAWAKRASG